MGLIPPQWRQINLLPGQHSCGRQCSGATKASANDPNVSISSPLRNDNSVVPPLLLLHGDLIRTADEQKRERSEIPECCWQRLCGLVCICKATGSPFQLFHGPLKLKRQILPRPVPPGSNGFTPNISASRISDA